MAMPGFGWYVLDENHVPVPEPDVLKAALFFEDFSKRCVAQHQVGESHVSTVFLGLDHNFSSSGPPLLFETRIEGGPLDGEQERYATWSEATAGHCSYLRILILSEPFEKPFTEVAIWAPKPERVGRTRFEWLLKDEE